MGLADTLGAWKVATGHYARILETDRGPVLARGIDTIKDQSYMLWGVAADLLRRMHFPLGSFQKDETRALARERGIHNSRQPESQEVCFIPDDDYRRFLRSRVAELPGEGEIVDGDGLVLGIHRGYIDYTVGQRHGLGLSAPEPLYVLGVIPHRNQVIAGSREQLAVTRLEIAGVNHLLDLPAGRELKVQVRYNSAPAPVLDISGAAGTMTLTLAEPVFGVAPGQSAVVYAQEMVAAGGVIISTS
jgi:tRNA-specific 2-thiouridylase